MWSLHVRLHGEGASGSIPHVKVGPSAPTSVAPHGCCLVRYNVADARMLWGFVEPKMGIFSDVCLPCRCCVRMGDFVVRATLVATGGV